MRPRPASLPGVEGLVPVLLTATNDPPPRVRGGLVFALADSRDAQVTNYLRGFLHDADSHVRLQAACLLTEFKDDTGMSEMKAALARLAMVDPDADALYYPYAELLLAALARITGRSYGEIPMVPALSSDTKETQRLKDRYNALMKSWRDDPLLKRSELQMPR